MRAALGSFGLCLWLAACGAGREGPFETGPGFRNPDVLIGVTSRFEASRFEGLWHIRAALPSTEEVNRINLETRATGVQIQEWRLFCPEAAPCEEIADTLQVGVEGPGRYVIVRPDGVRRRLWVLWIDEGFRTAAVGSPEGSFAWVLDRAPTGGADRIAAAKEILDFNGFDLSQLGGGE